MVVDKMYNPKLETDRLILRRYKESYIDVMLKSLL